MTRSWQKKCCICGDLSVSAILREELCESHLDLYYSLQRSVNFTADAKQLIKTMIAKRALEKLDGMGRSE